MRRLPKSQCGYNEYKCVGIKLMPVSEGLCFDTLCCDTRIAPESRDNDNNFYNLPRQFLGIVQQTSYIDLSGVQDSSSCCEFLYDPFDENRFSDLFSSVSRNANYIESLSDSGLACYGCSNSIYVISDAIERPGFLLPSLELNDFYPPLLEAIPTVALASPIDPASLNIDSDIESACTGFKITANLILNQKLEFKVASGKAIISEGGSEIDVEASATWTRNIGAQGQLQLQIYLVVWYDFETSTWQGKTYYQPNAQTLPTSNTKMVQLGTIRVKNRTVQIIQQVCSPVDVRDWVSQVALPSSGSAQSPLYVLAYIPNGAIIRWQPVKDCN